VWLAACAASAALVAPSDGYNPTIGQLAFSPAPCGCDLTNGVCDVDCCCDEDCTCNDANDFSVDCDCIDPMTATDFPYLCASSPVSSALYGPAADWLPVLCVEHEYNPLVGMFFPPVAALSDVKGIQSRLAEPARTRYSYGGDDALASSSSLSSSSSSSSTLPSSTYRFGTELMTYSESSTMLSGLFGVPTGIFGGCTDVNAVTYLEPRSTKCSRSAAEVVAGCAAGGVVDIAPYVSAYAGDFLLQQLGGRGGRQAINNVSIVVTAADGVVTKLTRVLPAAAAGISAFTAALDAGTGTCNRAVVSVRYSVVWSGVSIVQLVAWIELASVASARPLLQTFSVSFTTAGYTGTLPDAPSNANDRAGNPGYLIGRQLRDSAGAKIDMLAATSAGTCDVVSTQPVLFGVDQISGCTLMIAASNNCSAIRAAAAQTVDRAMSGLTELMPYGVDFAGVVAVLASNESELSEGAQSNVVDETAFPEAFCDDVLTQVRLDVMVVDQGRRANPQKRIIGAKLTRVYSSIQIGCSGPTSYTVGCINANVGASEIQLYHRVQFSDVPAGSFTYTLALKRPQPPSCRYTTCYGNIFYPFVTPWDETAALDAAYQRTKTYGLLLMFTTCIALTVWLTTR